MRCCVEIRQDNARVGPAVDIGSGNLAPENTEVRVTEIIGDDQDEVWRRMGCEVSRGASAQAVVTVNRIMPIPSRTAAINSFN